MIDEPLRSILFLLFCAPGVIFLLVIAYALMQSDD